MLGMLCNLTATVSFNALFVGTSGLLLDRSMNNRGLTPTRGSSVSSGSSAIKFAPPATGDELGASLGCKLGAELGWILG